MTKTATRPGAPPPLVPDDHLIKLFGVTGNLTKRKMLPDLFHLAAAEMRSAHYRIAGSGRPEGAPDADSFYTHVRPAIDLFGRHEIADETWERFAQTCLLRLLRSSSRTRSWLLLRGPSRSLEPVINA